MFVILLACLLGLELRCGHCSIESTIILLVFPFYDGRDDYDNGGIHSTSNINYGFLSDSNIMGALSLSILLALSVCVPESRTILLTIPTVISSAYQCAAPLS